MTDRAAECAHRWNFKPTEQLESGHCSHIYATNDRVLKVPFQGEELASGFVAALRIAGNLGPNVIEADSESGVVLMDRIHPGTTLGANGLNDAECQALVTGFIRQLQPLPTEGCLPLDQYFEEPDPLLDELTRTSPAKVFLHGDLHHGNILRNEEAWTVIDPKGLVGDPHYEPIAFLRNPYAWLATVSDLLSLIRARILRFAEDLNLDPWRIAAWGLIDSKPNPDTDPTSPWGRLPLVYQILVSEFPRPSGSPEGR